MRMLRRFTRGALLLSAAQWAWRNRDDIKRELQPVVDKGQAIVRDLRARRAGTAPLAEEMAAEEQAATAVPLHGWGSAATR